MFKELKQKLILNVLFIFIFLILALIIFYFILLYIFKPVNGSIIYIFWGIAAAGAILLIYYAAILISKQTIKAIESIFIKQSEHILEISHELKTPLTIAITNLAVIKNSKDKTIKSQIKWLNYIEYQLKQISNLTDKIMFLEQLNSPEQHNKENFNLTSLLRWHIKGLKALTDEKNISVNENMRGNVYIYSVKDYIKRLINILTDNAIKYTPENGIITVNLEDSKNKIFMSIENTGEGIDTEYIDRIFDRFYRINKTEGKNKSGNGLGLTIAKSILEKIGGEISVESSIGERATFYISLPKK